MRKIILLLFLFIGISSLISCAKLSNSIDADGGLIGSYSGDWIVIGRSGGIITDVYKMTNVMVQSERNSDGWLFVTNKNAVHVGGDMKAIRVNDKDSAEWDQYIEYHSEFTDSTYRQIINKKNNPTITMNREKALRLPLLTDDIHRIRDHQD